jgi:hypothetical protein
MAFNNKEVEFQMIRLKKNNAGMYDINEILDKISLVGISNLTTSEKKFLDNYNNDSYISEFVKPYNFISLNLNSRYILYGLMNIIIELDIFFYIEDKSEVINDISKMPIYIRLDWLKYNRNELDLKQLINILNIIKIMKMIYLS